MASKRNQRRKMCDGKERYTTKPGAHRALNKIPALERHKMHVYKCPFCAGSHNGHKMQKKRTRRKEFVEG